MPLEVSLGVPGLQSWSHLFPGETMKMGKDAIAKLLAPVKDIVAILDVVAQIHPAVQVSTKQM